MTRRPVRTSDHDPAMDEDPRLSSRQAGRARWDDPRYSRGDEYDRDYDREEHDRGLRGQAPRRDPYGAGDHQHDEPARGYGERRPSGVSPNTAEALSSVAGWIERAQEQLHQTADAANRIGAAARERRPEPEEASIADALAAIRRIEDRLSGEEQQRSAVREAADIEKTLRGFEARIGEVADRLSPASKMQPRRPLKPGQHLKTAVDEIRGHQGRLEREPVAGSRPSGLPALGVLARSQTAMLTTLKQEVAKLASRIEDIPAPRAQDHHVQREVETLRRSMSEVARREDLVRLERGLQSLTQDIVELRMAGEKSAPGPDLSGLQAEIRRLAQHGSGPDIAALQAEIRRMSEQRVAPVDIGPIALDIQNLSRKLDRMADSGVDPAVIVSLSDQIEHVHQVLADAVAPQAFGMVDEQLTAIRREIADVGGRQQTGTREVEALRSTIEDLRLSLDGFAGGASPRHDVAQAVREFGQPIEDTLTALVDKLERVERRVSDPEALDHLERQIQTLAARMGDGYGRDPSVAALERSMGDILEQVSSWRDGAMAAAEHAARTAVAETIDAMPVAAEVERHLMEIGDRYAAAEERTRQSLSAVHSSLSDVMVRLSSLETVPSRGEASRHAAPVGGTMPWMTEAPAASSRPTKADARGVSSSILPEADLPFGPALDDEVLLEPGAGRPSARPKAMSRTAQPPAAEETPDIKSSFIAAARRAAQAAAAETTAPAKSRGAAQPVQRGAVSPSDMIGRVRQLIDSKRRPLLLAAAAIVLALGTMQLVRTQFSGSSTTSVASAPTKPVAPRIATGAPAADTPAGRPERGDVTAATTPAPAPVADPVTTESIRPEPAAAPPSQIASGSKEPARVSEPVPAAPSPVPSLAARSPALGDPSVVLPVGIKQAADRGNPVALYELGVRTADGRGVTRDPKAAVTLFEKAADKGLAPAQYRLGNSYERGVGVPRDIEQAKSWYKRAAMAGNVRAMHNLAVLLADGGGTKPDYAGAVEWFTRAAEHGVKDSQFNLAVLHARGLGTVQDLPRAYHWLAIAARQGDEDAARKRDEVAQRLAPSDLARAKTGAERWNATPATVAANEVLVPPNGFVAEGATAGKRASREARV